MKEKSQTFLSWVELFRVPNLLTVPGDPLAGFFLAMGAAGRPTGHWKSAVLTVGASLAWYGMGLLLNDLADRQTDLRERPHRPLPSGRVRPRAVALAATILFAAGMLFSFLAGPLTVKIGVALAGTIILYNFLLKAIPVLGELTMGACRGLSLLLGASAACPPAQWTAGVWIAAVGLTLFIVAVTGLARHECEPNRRTPWIGPSFIGLLIGLLLFLQAGFILMANREGAGMMAAVFLVALWPLNRYLSRRFSAS